MKPYVIVTFYKFASIDNPASLKQPLLNSMQEFTIKGTLILATEGINGTFCGHRDEIHNFRSQLNALLGLSLPFRETYDDFNPFDKAKVKLRPEIVTMGVDGINPNELPGTHLSPEEWNALISDPEVVLIDTRNSYEVELGTFKNAINPKTENFRDFPAYVKENLLDKKNKKIAMCCTGGVRCEKSTTYLKKLGFQEVYQLQGGILNYLETIPAEQSLWEGTCFVFDNRVVLDGKLASPEKGSIDIEWKNNHRKKAMEKIG